MIRPYHHADIPQLVSLWSRTFQDPPELIQSFYDLLPCMGCCCVAEEAGRVLGMAHLVHGFTLQQPDRNPVTCGYLYAVAVEEEARGRGLGAGLSQFAATMGKEQGAQLLCTLPAEESLYRWYADILSLNCRAERTVYTAAELPKGCFRISTGEYGYYREDILFRTPHVELNNAAMEFEAQLCASYGGGLYRTGSALFCAMQEGNGWVFPELLSFAPTKVRTASPLFARDELPKGFKASVRPFLASASPLPGNTIWNLTFD